MPYHKSYDVAREFISPYESSSDDLLGIGGDMPVISSHDGQVLEVRNLDKGTYFFNRSPVPFKFSFDVRIPQMYKSGFGRPTWSIGYSNGSVPDTYTSNSATVKNGEPKKGMTAFGDMVINPGGFLRLSVVDADYTKKMLPNYVAFSATDDYGGIDSVVPPPRVKEVGPDGMEAPQSTIASASDGASVLSWNGPTQSNGMNLSAYSAGFPDGVSVDTVNTSQGLRQYMRNNGQVTYTAILFYYLADYSGNWYRSGNIDGENLTSGGHSRVLAYADLSPGASFAYEPDQTGSFSSYSSIVFRRCSYADRYLYGVFT